jgi:hypothetical protein
MADEYKVLVKKASDVKVGETVRAVGEATNKGLKALGQGMKDERVAVVQSVGEKSINIGFGDMPVPARAVNGLKFKFYRKAKARGRTAKKKEGGRRHTRRR